MMKLQQTLGVIMLSLGVVVHATESESMITAILKRYYIIKRLEKTIETLVKAHQQKKTVHITATEVNLFSNPLLKRAFIAMENSKSPIPFYTAWGTFLAYRFIDNTEFVQEMLTAVLVLYKELLVSMTKKTTRDQRLIRVLEKTIQKIISIRFSDCSPLITEIHKAHAHYTIECRTTDCFELNSVLTSHHLLKPFYQEGVGHAIEDAIGIVQYLLSQADMNTIARDNTLRFYYIQRLVKSMFVLSRQKISLPFSFDENIREGIKSPAIKTVMAALVEQRSVEPLFKVWSQLTTYSFIGDVHFVHEFTLITCLAYLQIVQALTKIIGKTINPQDLVTLYEHISQIPLSELLDLLDDVVEQYDMLAQQYALKDSSLSWKDWLEKYWWTAPVMISSFIATIFQNLRIFFIQQRVMSSFKN